MLRSVGEGGKQYRMLDNFEKAGKQSNIIENSEWLKGNKKRCSENPETAACGSGCWGWWGGEVTRKIKAIHLHCDGIENGSIRD